MKFLCDQMLHRLGKWLRAAGHDTLIITYPASDQQVLALALAEERLLITRDRDFLTMKAAASLLIYLKSADFESCVSELNQRLLINWLYAPFSRCLVCNLLLKHKKPDESLTVPLAIRQQSTDIWYCLNCQQYYWKGSHTLHMFQQLLRWQKEVDLFFSQG